MEQRTACGGCAASLGVVVTFIAAAAPLAVSSTGQVAHALDEHVMTEPMEQGALLHGSAGGHP